LVGDLCRSHEHHPELLLYEPFLFPLLTGEAKPKERDPMADVHLLREFLRALWKLMINIELLWMDMGEPVDWEGLAVDALDVLFRGIGSGHLFEMPVWEYQDIRVDRFQ
jgi:hypothetical protein